MAQPYQAYSKPSYGGSPAPPSYSHNPESYPAQQPHQTTFAPPQQHNMSDMKQPNVAYQPQLPMSEKPQPPMPGHSNGKVQSKFGPRWTFGMFDCCSPFSTCLLGCCCPCVLFGRTYAREHGEGESSGCGGMVRLTMLIFQFCQAFANAKQCCVWYLAASFGFNSCLQCVMRYVTYIESCRTFD